MQGIVRVLETYQNHISEKRACCVWQNGCFCSLMTVSRTGWHLERVKSIRTTAPTQTTTHTLATQPSGRPCVPRADHCEHAAATANITRLRAVRQRKPRQHKHLLLRQRAATFPP